MYNFYYKCPLCKGNAFWLSEMPDYGAPLNAKIAFKLDGSPVLPSDLIQCYSCGCAIRFLYTKNIKLNNRYQNTSLEAYKEVAVGERQSQVLAMISKVDYCCNSQLAKWLDWSINRVTPRVLELREKGLVVEHMRDKYNGRTVIFWKAKEQ